MKATDARLVAAVLSGATVRDVAAELDVSERQVYRRLARPDVREAIDKSAREMARSATLVLQRGADSAARALVAMADGREKASYARVSAAKAVIELALRAVDLDELQTRLAALEGAGRAPWGTPQ